MKRSLPTRLYLLLSVLVLLLAPLAAGPSNAHAQDAQQSIPNRALLQDQSTGQVYLLFDGTRHLITTPQVLALLGLDQVRPIALQPGELSQFVAGTPFTLRTVQGQIVPLSPIASGSPMLELNTPTVTPGGQFAVRGSGFQPGERVLLILDQSKTARLASSGPTRTITAGPTGQFIQTVTVPSSTTTGIVRVFAVGESSRIVQVEPISVVTAVVTATMTVNPTSTNPGATVAVSGTGFRAGELVLVFFTPGGSAMSVAASTAGTFSVPAFPVPATISAGRHTIQALGLTSHRSARVDLTIVAVPAPAPGITITPSSLHPGDRLGVSGHGFAANELVSIQVGANTALIVRADSSGSFANVSYIVPAALKPGTYTVRAEGTSSGRAGTASLTVTAIPSQPQVVLVNGALFRDVSTGRVYLIWAGVRHWITNGDTFTALGYSTSSIQDQSAAFINSIPEGAGMALRMVNGVVYPLSPITSGSATLRISLPGAAPGAAVTLAGSGFGTNETVQVTFAGNTFTVTADGNGNFSATVTVPAGTSVGTVLRVYAYGTVSKVLQVEPISVINPAPAPRITAQPTSIDQGGSFLVTGSGFASGERVNILLAQGVSVTTVTADANGAFTNATVTVPPFLSAGQHSLTAFGVTSKLVVIIQVTITLPAPAQATITLNHASANPGSLVLVSGSGFAGGELVNILFAGKLAVAVTADASGKFANVGFTVPVSTASGTSTVTATGTQSNHTATAGLTIIAFNPSVAVNPNSSTPGAQVAITGQGFAPGEIVTLALNGEALATSPAVITASSSGTFTATITVPATALAGSNTLVATGATSRGTVTAVLNVNLPVQSTWYFAGGNTRSGYSTQIALVNPNSQPAAVTFSFMFTTGAPVPYSVTVPANSRSTVDVNGVVGPNRDVFTMITADRKLGAEETVYRNGQDFSSTIGTSAPLHTWYLAEGYTGLTFHEYIRIFNPGTSVASADLRLLPFNGRPATSVQETINAQSGLIVDVNAIEPGLSLSAIVDSDQPVVVDRLITFGPGGYGATEQMGSNTPSSTWLFAEGSTLNNFETYLTILNPSSSQPAAVTATFFDRAGNVLGNDTILIDPLRRGNIKVNDIVRSSGIATILTSNIPVVAERPLYFGAPNSATAAAGGSDVFGRNGGGVSWLFPEGETGSGTTEFLLLQNPSTQTAEVRVRFYNANGQTVDHSLVLPAKSRATIDVIRDVPALPSGAHGSLVTSTNGVPIIAEQSIYMNNFATGDGTAGIAQ